MILLGLDTALSACSVAVTRDGEVLAAASEPMLRGHQERLAPMVQAAMTAAGVPFAAVDRVGVTVGPGSFTGLRVGIAAARGFALATNKPAIGLTTLAAFAAPLIAEDDTLPVVAAIDARHEHVYLQVFGPGGRTLVPPRVASLRDALRAATTSRGARLVGTGASLLAAAWPTSERPPRSVEQRGAPDIDWIAQLGAAAPEDAGPPKPLYLKPPDAQPQEAALIARR